MEKQSKFTALWRRYGIWIGAAIIVCLLPSIFRSSFSRSMLSQMGIAMIFALSYNMLLGEGGLLSFGHAVFYGLGGFISSHALNLGSGAGVPIPL
jgi:branched-chain amino acid transport system permease protein